MKNYKGENKITTILFDKYFIYRTAKSRKNVCEKNIKNHMKNDIPIVPIYLHVSDPNLL